MARSVQLRLNFLVVTTERRPDRQAVPLLTEAGLSSGQWPSGRSSRTAMFAVLSIVVKLQSCLCQAAFTRRL